MATQINRRRRRFFPLVPFNPLPPLAMQTPPRFNAVRLKYANHTSEVPHDIGVLDVQKNALSRGESSGRALKLALFCLAQPFSHSNEGFCRDRLHPGVDFIFSGA